MAKYVFSTNQKHPLGKRRCSFCTNQMDDIDYKDVNTLKHFINGFKKPIKCLGHLPFIEIL